ncbi:hypothetical protein MBLNU230_g5499t1 [Neophaeotheca triangularis]
MLSKARGEDKQVKTVSLAKGTVNAPVYTPSAPTSNPGQTRTHSNSVERSSVRRSSSTDGGSSNTGRDSSTSMGAMLNSIGVVELLEQDERPTFITDLGEPSNYGQGPLHSVFANQALTSNVGLFEQITGTALSSPGSQDFMQFKSWLLSAAVGGESLNVCLPAVQFAGLNWNCSTLRKRLRIVSGTFTSQTPTSNVSAAYANIASTGPSGQPGSASTGMPLSAGSNALTNVEPSDYFGTAAAEKPMSVCSKSSEVMPTIESNASAQLNAPNAQSGMAMHDGSAFIDLLPSPSTQIALAPTDAPSFDWTRLPITDSMPQHIRFARSIDWSQTSLGPIDFWSSDLRQMCNLIMASPHPAAMYWGEDLIAIYNEAYILLAGQKHPTLMGQSYREAWAEIWDEVREVFATAKSTGEATMKDDDCLFIKRNNYLEETYFSWSIIPMVGGDGSVMGLYNPAFEKTRRRIAERRMLTLREIGERTAAARDVKGFWEQVLGAFAFNAHDSPFMLLYSVADDNDSDSSSMHSNSVSTARQCSLEGSLGVPEGHIAAPSQIDLKAGMEGFGPVFREVMNTDKPVLLEVGSRDLPEGLLEGLEWRGFGDPVRAVVICPIHPTTGESILGFLVLGVNPRRPYDDDYSLFVQLLSRQLATSLASVVLFEEEIRRGQKAAKLAALDRIELSEQLEARTREAIESESRFTRMAEFAPVGMFIAGSDGRIVFANDTWYDISGVPKDRSMADTWMESVHPADKDMLVKLWHDLVVDTKSVSSEFRFKAPWSEKYRDTTREGETWVLFSAYPEPYADSGKLKSIFGSITNISQQKWAEGIQTRKMEEAVELKRQKDNFIDITSHEMRNPLSAMLQCSDEITTSINNYRKKLASTDKKLDDNGDDVLANCLDAAQTISLCSQHQKRIVDDILTLSKLDSALLLVTPVEAQPLTVVKRALKMHEGELQAADIQMKFVVDQSFRDLGLDWVRFDPSRVLQVLINLTTNAIKFTTNERKRTVTVTIATSLTRPSEATNPPVAFFPPRRKPADLFSSRDWGDGQSVYILFSVADTGRGLSAEEKKLLFLRFSQATPRTHITYGGSGLGLFISRELTELQGGEIGVESEAGKGSTFAFYVLARRSEPPSGDSVAAANGGAARIPSDAVGKKEALALASKPDGMGKLQVPAVGERAVDKEEAAKVVRKVLIVEDNLVNQRVLQKQLKNLGTEVHLANHGGEALEKLRQSTYWTDPDGSKELELGVVLMDQEMPVMDGLTCTRRIRELEKEGRLTGHIPIIAVTANARAEQIQTALDAGMDDVVSKPFRIPELVPKIEELMARYPMPAKQSGVAGGATATK